MVTGVNTAYSVPSHDIYEAGRTTNMQAHDDQYYAGVLAPQDVACSLDVVRGGDAAVRLMQSWRRVLSATSAVTASCDLHIW